MKLLRTPSHNAFQQSGCVLTIGDFDAVHLGHQKMISRLVEKGGELNLPAVLMSFAPSPEAYFRKSDAAPRLTSISEQYFALSGSGIDTLLVLPFNRQLANTAAPQFIDQYLLSALNVRYLLVGDDFRFGKDRSGDFALLADAGKKSGFDLEQMTTVELEGERISSTRVRAFLNEGNLQSAAKMLGRNYSMTGRVAHGDKRGREWGFPTLNIPLRRTPPLTGVFAVLVKIENGGTISGVANLGTRPTVDGMRTLLEVHLFEFDGEIYGHRICVEFMEKIRHEQKFDSFELLQKQIFQDCESAKTILSNRLEG